ncbi:TolB family protein [Flagellimonas aequoris]|uniref:Flagellar motor protein MotB n=1 Tax=Flagellimonas aequoris TaxID=2306997 RepID=A0A418N8I4_9FLAO|nr:PD40 domain-containing protein [Allomuricauda aequoris]RIV71565.1 hypothetical protein D2U88_07305 [Allomuricauda aequoris]TXK03129.1 hypothetical protein FQ019_07250 [Allomuricauda aequoris]
MKKTFLCIMAIATLGCADQPQGSNYESWTAMPGYQLDSNLRSPIKFFPEIVSTSIDKFNTTFSPDGNTIYYSATSQKLGITGIAYQKFDGNTFSQPEFVPFSSSDTPIADVQISPDGNQLLFATFKHYEGKPEGFNFNLWSSSLKDGKWQDPEPIGEPIASSGNEFYPIMTKNGSLYFNSDRTGNSDIYFSRFENGSFQEPVPLPENINSESREADAFISQDESFIIFVRVDEPDGFGNSDLYISFNKGSNEWTDPINMGENINSDQIDGSPYVTPDHNYLIFTTGRRTTDIQKRAMTNYSEFKSIQSSSENGSLNFYIVQLDLAHYKNLAY